MTAQDAPAAPPEVPFDEILEGSPVPTFVIDATHRVTHWNRACELILGVTAASVVGSRDQWKPFYAQPRPVMADLVVSGQIETLGETYYKSKFRRSRIVTGSYEAEDFFAHIGCRGTWLYFTAAPLKDRHGRVVGAIETLQDISDRKRAEQRLSELLEEQRVIFDNAHVGIAHLRQRTILNCNQRLAEIFGYASAGELRDLDSSGQYFASDECRADGESIDARLAATGVSEDEVLLRRRDGSPIWCQRSGRLLEPGQPEAGSIWVFSDISEQKRQRQQLELARTVFDSSSEALLITDGNNRIISVNAAFTTITGYPAAEVIGKHPRQFKSDRHDDAFFVEMWKALHRDGRWQGEVWDRRRNGEIFAKWLSLAVVRDKTGAITHYIAAFSDITQRKAAEERIHFLAHHDTLTGLPNRVLLRSRFEHSIGQARRNATGLAMLFLDLDQFKRVNDSLGHKIGDQLLIAVVGRLKKCLRDTDTISRQGGDEFVILLEDAESSALVSRIAVKILDSLEPPFEIDGHSLSTSISIGAALFPQDGTDFDTLLKKSDTAMYHAKANGRSTYSFFNERMNTDANERLRLHNMLRRALSQREFGLQYQPQVLVRSGRVFGAEALLRWHTADGETILPDRFIPLAEESGLIIPIGDWVIGSAFRQARLWQDAGVRLRLGINVSGLHIYRVDLPKQLEQALRDAGIRPDSIEIELTESVLMQDAVTAREVVGEIKQLGFQVAIDDFGTGYSSLAYLKKFHVDKLKIDRSFVTDLCSDDEDQAITRAVIGLARSLNLRAIAEGVETSGQFDFLKKHGCHEAQGFLFSRPTSAEAVTQMLVRH